MNDWLLLEKSYKKAIKRLIAESDTPRGMVSKIADFIGCQRSYFSQVLHSKVQLNKDQAWAVSRFFGLNALQTRYFELLVDYERAATSAYKKHVESQMHELRKQSENLAPRFSANRKFDEELARLYYSSWIPSAVHILSSIPDYQRIETMVNRLGLSPEILLKNLNALAEHGLVKTQQNKWIYAGGASYVPKDSACVSQHHQNWRTLACEDSRAVSSSGIHYTMLQSMSEIDYEMIKAIIVEFIERTKKIAEPSEPQVLTTLNIDFFQPRSEFVPKS
jgi:uncharacterized protein (TIGR02147 family)